MKIRHYLDEKNNYCSTFKSKFPVLVTYRQLTAIAVARGFEKGVDYWLNLEGCPTPVNLDNDAEDKLCDGVWLYDRITTFIGWGEDEIDENIMRHILEWNDIEV